MDVAQSHSVAPTLVRDAVDVCTARRSKHVKVSSMFESINMESSMKKARISVLTAVAPLLGLLVVFAIGCQSSPTVVEVTRVVDVERAVEVPVTRRVEVTRLATVLVEVTRIVEVAVESVEESRPQWELDYLNGGLTHAVLPGDTNVLTSSFNSGVANDNDGSYTTRYACLSKFVAGQGWRVSHMGEPAPFGTRCEAIADIVLGRVYLANDKVVGIPVPTDEFGAILDADLERLLEWTLDYLGE